MERCLKLEGAVESTGQLDGSIRVRTQMLFDPVAGWLVIVFIRVLSPLVGFWIKVPVQPVPWRKKATVLSLVATDRFSPQNKKKNGTTAMRDFPRSEISG
ncbi:hypothetical protein NDU88_007708 [Pleurodeles waltl]|uniref:Uncharacterized protein n=1 Tax=Pleurodeles waltl TaxID=8319 RepID=A0AAV7VUK9_PLEWA|nr:hypothetical protein NDU88_007708 [Pleurodeles waltl]